MFAGVWSIFEAGGWAMWPLLACSVASVAISLERLAFWLRTHSPRRPRLIAELASALRSGDTQRVRKLVKHDRSCYGVFTAALVTDESRAPTEAIAREAVERVRPAIERSSGTMSTIITAAPMLGILGTVTGIIDSFRILGDSTVTDPSLVAGGIAEALITTAFGLIIALATLFPYMASRTHAERAFNRLEVLAASAAGAQSSSEESARD